MPPDPAVPSLPVNPELTTQGVTQYYDWLYSQYYQNTILPWERPINWSTLLPELYFGLFMVVFFLLFSLDFLHQRRDQGELYGLTSYAGNIVERNGKVGTLLWLLFAFLFLWAFYYAIEHIVTGQVY